ncbi:MAG: DUF87 domain-containing protein [Thermodesulfovibrionales bacterium]|nr:DUF87 domain-containing protein [Thermodesulfovibrionales bacterium]
MKEYKQCFSQPVRLLFLVLYMLFLFVMNRIGFGQWLPLTSSKGLWFYSGAAALILGSFLVTPFFTSPANAISYLVAALIAVFILNPTSSNLIDTFPRNLVILFCLVMLFVCMFNIIFKNSKKRELNNFSEIGRILADNIGSPKFVYAIILGYALWEYHRQEPMELLFVGLAGIVIVAQQPLEIIGNIVQRIRSIWRPKKEAEIVGNIAAYQIPNLVLIRQENTRNIPLGECLLIADSHSGFKVAVALGYCGRDEGILLRALEIEISNEQRSRFEELGKRLPEGSVSIIKDAENEIFRRDVELLNKYETFVGIVAPDTSTERLYFEVIQERGIEQGRLVETNVCGKKVLYQVLDGLTKEEIIQQKNTYGFSRGEAVQVGIWDDDKKKFGPCNWIPQLNAPVFLKKIEKQTDNPKAIGYFPSSNYNVDIKNIDELVTHNTAILGILGVGKSMLAIEIVERLINHGIKVVCLDLTNQYASELSEFYDIENEKKCLKIIQEAGEKDRDEFADNPDKGGSIQYLRSAILDDLNNFLKKDNPFKLKIYNPAEITATKQQQEPKSYNDGKQWRRSAGLWQVTPVEITCIITEACLMLLQDAMTEKAQVCLVFEEAHSLIPERNFITVDGDQRAASGTARAILQGRKYGLGCLLVTQRTANVSKTILNQCNTIFAMRTFDETGKDFLSNYISLKYACKLPTLKERQAVFFGRASSCENPVMIRLNNRDDFLRVFREEK